MLLVLLFSILWLLLHLFALFFSSMLERPPRSTLFPYTTPSDLTVGQMRNLIGRRELIVVLGGAASWPVTSLGARVGMTRSEEHTSELQSLRHLVCRLLLEKKKINEERSLNHVRSHSCQL